MKFIKRPIKTYTFIIKHILKALTLTVIVPGAMMGVTLCIDYLLYRRVSRTKLVSRDVSHRTTEAGNEPIDSEFQ